MKLATYVPKRAHSPESGIGAVVGEELIDLTFAYARYLRETEGEIRAYELARARIPRDMIGFLEGGARALEAARRSIALVQGLHQEEKFGLSGELLAFPLSDIRLLAPIPRPGKILAAGRNYAEHAKEAPQGGAAVETRPFPGGFVKVSSVVIGPGDPVELPHVTKELDYEVELAIVIGKPGRYLAKENAYDYVAGYTILNDISARDIQLSEAKYGNHLLGKNLDGLAPMGPWIVTRDEIEDPMDLQLQLSVNGELRQKASTATMIHDIPTILQRWSWGTLEPGDVIATGTPAGVALGGKFPYLRHGDIMECSIEGIGSLRNQVVPEKS